MESTHSDQAEGKSSLSEKDYEGLTLNLHPANDDDEESYQKTPANESKVKRTHQ